MPKTFSIITTVFDSLDGLEKTHHSLRNQISKKRKFQDIEWIVIDKNSVDGAEIYLQRHQEEVIRLTASRDESMYDAMNKALEIATGQYILFLHAGDVLADEKILYNVKETIRTEKPDFLYGDVLEHSPTAPHQYVFYRTAQSYKQVWQGMFTPHPAMFFKRSVINSLRYKNLYTEGADYEFTIQALRLSKHITRITKPVCVLERKTWQAIEHMLNDHRRIRADVLGFTYPLNIVVTFMRKIRFSCRRRFPFFYRKHMLPS